MLSAWYGSKKKEEWIVLCSENSDREVLMHAWLETLGNIAMDIPSEVRPNFSCSSLIVCVYFMKLEIECGAQDIIT